MADDIQQYSAIERRKSRYQDLAPIYAGLARAIAEGLIRYKGLSPEDAEVEAVRIALDQARDTLVGLEDMDGG